MSTTDHMVVACQGGERTALERRPVPVVGAGEMLLKLRVVGFCGTDLFKLTTGAAAPGTVLGHEIVGEVAELGAGVDAFRAGDRVCVPHHVPCGECTLCRRGNETMCETFRENLMEPGGFADTILIKPRATRMAAHRVPDAVADEAAVFMEPAACVLRGVHRSGLEAGGVAVVQGGGSMGLLHLLVLKAALPDVAVAVVDPVAARCELALSLGADAAQAPGGAAETAVAQLTDGIGADAVFDTVGGNGPLEAALALARQGGSVVLFAHAPDGERAGFDLNDLFKYERRILGTYSGALAEQAAVFDLVASGALDPTPLVTHTLPLDEFDAGVQLVKDRKALKVLFTPSRAAGGG
ncbi:MAG: alcohol dehydrogenase catalytic domain-containing protein [Magnetovibrio sp.]|nr:alcohol dehydrogenase catalytic domain-containing protein [Magnetovibrio sp.]